MTSFFSDKLSGRADTGGYCHCLMQNTNNRLGKYISELFVPSKLINEPSLDHFIPSKEPTFMFDIPEFLFSIPYPVKFCNKYPVPYNFFI